MFEIEIYPDEQNIAEAIKKSSVISTFSAIEETEPFDVSEEINRLCASERTSFDLYYLKSILFSSVWNKNDELFLPSEMFAAKETGNDKPFNYEHINDDIIGHTVDSHIIDDSGKILSSADELPNLIHVLSNAVLYKCWDKKEKQERMDSIIGEIKEGKWGVSVECLFPKFDYALKDSDGNIEIISRNKETAFLTKYLKTFNGVGVYDGRKIARVPRNFIISGKGLTRTPANQASKILAHKLSSINTIKSNSEKELVYLSNDNKEVKKMDNTKELEYQKTISDLKVALDELKASIASNEVTKVKAELDVEKKNSEAHVQEINALKATIEKINSEKLELNKATEEVVKAKNSIEQEFNKLVETNKLQARLNAVKTELKMNDEDAKVFLESVNKLSDEAFNSLIGLQKKFTVNTVVKEEVKIDEEGAKKVVASVNEPNLTIDVQDEKQKMVKLQASIAEYVALQKQSINKVGEKNKFSK